MIVCVCVGGGGVGHDYIIGDIGTCLDNELNNTLCFRLNIRHYLIIFI